MGTLPQTNDSFVPMVAQECEHLRKNAYPLGCIRATPAGGFSVSDRDGPSAQIPTGAGALGPTGTPT